MDTCLPLGLPLFPDPSTSSAPSALPPKPLFASTLEPPHVDRQALLSFSAADEEEDENFVPHVWIDRDLLDAAFRAVEDELAYYFREDIADQKLVAPSNYTDFKDKIAAEQSEYRSQSRPGVRLVDTWCLNGCMEAARKG
jgi:hypothetical protein